MSEPILALDNVSKIFGSAGNPVYAARSVSFALRPGRTLALVGESGSGKTTAARLIMREYQPDDGRLLFRGATLGKADRKSLAAYRASVQMVFQDPFASLNPAHTIRYHLERPLRLHQGRLSGSERMAMIEELLARVKLDPALVMAKYPHELSGGQRQRISIARALAVNPQVIVADEPTSMLDVSVRLGILNLLNDMKAQLGLALLYITHDIATARYVAEEIMVMYAGQIVEWGDMESVLGNPQHPYTRLLLSAVPDPDRRFDQTPFEDELNHIDVIRRQSALPQPETLQVGENHFIRPMPR
ncbi:ABC transporter ATP-binding protein [Paradevosia shaoguanensis]|uniref:ATP-binding cassette domain-containing protein n=1 Tax=Paradevosia shaoguanensis TaxID=1335043 RepID=A0AA41QM23_9HYPH|nr:ATP-binding cassette domain-containing protein [Paradevosia shaoguanensis]MCF1742512.1 ATP-binding cassette domain-containing protein [Paradevosia shaoguanensis]MCI0126995.1 ATP-binding cassette domain-containing protein [Paradevosia shaoguanensis]